MPVSHSGAGASCKIARCTVVLSNRVNTVRVVSSEMSSVLNTGVRVETPKGDGDVNITNRGVVSSSVGRSSSKWFCCLTLVLIHFLKIVFCFL